jgi:2-methylisocitrate lyase-like PEP mutase family enzyme
MEDTINSQAEKGARFAALHRGPDLLLLPNPWDVASALLMQRAGFAAVATTSAGIGYSLGYPVSEAMPRDEMLCAVERIASRLSIPLSADMEAGFGKTPEDVAETVRLTIQAGAVGINIEDASYRKDEPLIDLGLAAERIRAAREAADATGIPFVLNARTDVYWRGGTGPHAFDEAVRRANAYRAAGADCLFLPNVEDAALIRDLVRAIDGPLNLLAGARLPAVPELAALGVRRVSIGAGLARAAYGALDGTLAEIRDTGTFSFWSRLASHAELNRLLGG